MSETLKLTEKEMAVAETYLKIGEDFRMIASCLGCKIGYVKRTMDRERVQTYIENRRREKVADTVEVQTVLSRILRGEYRETAVKVLHRKESYYDETGKKCQRDEEYLGKETLEPKVADIWRAADLLCKLQGNSVTTEEFTLPLIIDGNEALEE